MSLTTLRDKVVVITGAGSGIGRALAVRAAGRGALLALSDWNADGLAETVRLVEHAGAAKVRHDVVDVSDRDAVRQWAAWVIERADAPTRQWLGRREATRATTSW